jgi:hypothetical protein
VRVFDPAVIEHPSFSGQVKLLGHVVVTPGVVAGGGGAEERVATAAPITFVLRPRISRYASTKKGRFPYFGCAEVSVLFR